MGIPIWTSASYLGSVKYANIFEKTVKATDAVSYNLVSGELPQGVSLSSAGVISGLPVIDNPTSNTPIFVFTFTVRATSSTSQTTDRTFTLSVIYGNIFVPVDLRQTGVRYTSNQYQYQIFRGTVDSANNKYWQLEYGNLPPNATISSGGLLSGFMTGISSAALPLARETFLNSTQLSQSGPLSQESWDAWLHPYLEQAQEYDYQFSVVLSNQVDAAELSLTVRIIYTKIPAGAVWFQDNQISFDPNQYYFFIAISDNDYIIWDSNSDLGSINNGAVSDLSITAHSNSGKSLNYIIKPGYHSKLPQQMVLFSSGLISGRVSFRTYQDDPANVPLNDDYSFTVRAYTTDGFTYGEKTFNLHVNRFHSAPYDNLWVRAFAPVEERLQLQSILNNQVFFPDELIYRKTDPWFGKARSLRFLFSPGLQPNNTEQYYAAMANNHYNKNIMFGGVHTAVAYDDNLNVKYEVVYLPVIDPLTGIDPTTRQLAGLPNTIDLRDQITNFYLKENQAYYLFKPNGLDNMRSQLKQVIGFYDQGILPDWMISPQPIPGKIGQFYMPPGFIPAVVLAYTQPGGSDLIAFRLNYAGINFNQFRFEFDRYEFDYLLSQEWYNDEFAQTAETGFDNNTTIFENGGTKFIEGLSYYPGMDSAAAINGDKYLKFPKYGVFG